MLQPNIIAFYGFKRGSAGPIASNNIRVPVIYLVLMLWLYVLHGDAHLPKEDTREAGVGAFGCTIFVRCETNENP